MSINARISADIAAKACKTAYSSYKSELEVSHFENDQPEGGGLVIDYTPKGYQEVLRITLAFTDTGMWRHPLPSPDGDQ